MSKLALPERLTLSEGRTTLQRLLPQLESASVAELDASPLRELDSAAVALLLECQRQAQKQGRALQIIGAPEKLRKLAQLYGVDELLAI